MDQKAVEKYFRLLLEEGLGLSLDDPNLSDTPKRVAKMYCQELFSGLSGEFDNWTVFEKEDNYNQIIMADNIHFTSICSHHFLPFIGKVWVLYLPNYIIAGASKLVRVVEHYAARPQIQEKLCHDILNNLVQYLNPLGAMVVIRAVHQCMICRGVKQPQGTGFVTSALHGRFNDPSVKEEALQLIRLSEEK